MSGENGEEGVYELDFSFSELELQPLTLNCPPDLYMSCDVTVPSAAATLSDFLMIGGTYENAICGDITKYSFSSEDEDELSW